MQLLLCTLLFFLYLIVSHSFLSNYSGTKKLKQQGYTTEIHEQLILDDKMFDKKMDSLFPKGKKDFYSKNYRYKSNIQELALIYRRLAIRFMDTDSLGFYRILLNMNTTTLNYDSKLHNRKSFKILFDYINKNIKSQYSKCENKEKESLYNWRTISNLIYSPNGDFECLKELYDKKLYFLYHTKDTAICYKNCKEYFTDIIYDFIQRICQININPKNVKDIERICLVHTKRIINKYNILKKRGVANDVNDMLDTCYNYNFGDEILFYNQISQKKNSHGFRCDKLPELNPNLKIKPNSKILRLLEQKESKCCNITNTRKAQIDPDFKHLKDIEFIFFIELNVALALIFYKILKI